MKRPEKSPLPALAQEPETASKADNDTQMGGHHWLRQFGVATSRRTADKKITGADVTSLGSLEAEIMGLLWEIGRPANGMEVAEAALYKRRSQSDEPIAFSTVNTTLRRLADKGLLVSQKGESRTPYYVPTVGREEMAARILNNVSQTLLGRSLHGLIPKLIGGLNTHASTPSDVAESERVALLMRALEQAAHPSTGEPEAGNLEADDSDAAI